MVEIKIKVKVKIDQEWTEYKRQELAKIIVEGLYKQLGTKFFEIEHD